MNGLSLRCTGVGGSRKRNGKSYAIEPLHFDTSLFSGSLDVEPFIKADNVTFQIEFIKKLGERIKSDNDSGNKNENLAFIIGVFLNSPLKHPLKNTCSKLLLHLNSVHDVCFMLFDKLTHLITNADFENISELNEICNSIYVCAEMFSLNSETSHKIMVYLKNVMNLYINIISNDITLSPTKKMEIYTFIHNTSRSLILLLQKGFKDSISLAENTWSEDARQICNILLNHHELPMDTKGNCAIVLILLLNLQLGEKTWIEVLKYVFQNDEDKLENNPFYFDKSNVSKLVISNAILNIINLNTICFERINNISSFLYICSNFVILSETSSTDTTLILGIARGLLLISKYLSKIDVQIAIEATNIILDFVWSYIDYYVDSVRHLTIQTLTNIVKLSVLLDEVGNHEISSSLIKTIVEIPKNQSLNFKALATLGSNYNCSYLLQKNPQLPQNMLSNINNYSDTSNISTAFEVLMMKHCKEVGTDLIFNTWITPILDKLQNIISSTDSELSSSILSAILLKAVKLNPQILQLLIDSIVEDNSSVLTDGHIKCMLICLNVARKSGYFDTKESSNEQWKNTVSYELLNIAVIHHVIEIRLLAYSLIIESHKTTEYFTREEFAIVLNFLKYNINVKSTNVHQKILSFTKKLSERWQVGCVKCMKDVSELKFSYEKFLRDLFELCLKNIFPGANFSRRNIALQVLIWIQEIYNKPENKLSSPEWNEDDALLIFNFIEDSFECNKQLAVKLLILIPTKLELFNDFKLWENTFSNTISKASSVKPTDCMSSAYKLELLTTKYPDGGSTYLKKLNTNLKDSDIVHEIHFNTIKYLLKLLKQENNVAKNNILDAAANGPMYGLLYCIRHLLEKIEYSSISRCKHWSDLINEMIGACFEVNESVKPIVNNSSPEGHLPMDFNAGSSHIITNGVKLENGKSVTAQMVLLCAWRSVKEVSLLLGDISYGANIVHDDGTITVQHLLDIGDHFITLLSETKHRGAFEQAYLGFSKLCLRLWKCDSKHLHDLPHTWLNDLITAISSGDSKNSKLCATRRSAGVPFIIQALVTTELQACSSPKSFQKCMETLLRLAKFNEMNNSYTVETRTHSLNILRALFRHASLGEYVNAYVADALITSINGFNGATWAERNSSTLLFSSLMIRIFGVQRTKDSEHLSIRNKMTGRIFFLRYPKLYDFLLDCLKTAVECQDKLLQPSLYPVLLLLSRLYPSSLEGTDSNLQLINFIPYLILCSENCVLKIRKLTAKAIVPLISLETYISHILNIFKLLIIKGKSSNFQHGILLQLTKLLQSIPMNLVWSDEDLKHLMQLINNSYWILEQISCSKPCFVILDAYTDVLLLLIHKVPELVKFNNGFFETLDAFIDNIKIDTNSISLAREQFQLKIFHLKILLNGPLFKKQNGAEISSVLIQNLTGQTHEIRTATLNYVLCLKNIDDRFEIEVMEKLFIDQSLTKDFIKEIINILDHSPKYRKNLMSSLERCNNFQDVEKIHSLISTIPNSIKEILYSNISDDHILNDLLDKYDSENERLNYVYLKHVQNFFKQNDCCDKIQFDNIKKLLMILKDIPLEGEEIKKEITTDILIENWNLITLNSSMNNEIFEMIILKWLTVLRLLSNSNDYILHRIGHFIYTALNIKLNPNQDYYYNENMMIEILLDHFVDSMLKVSLNHCTAMLIVFALGEDDSIDDSLDDENLVFDKGTINEIHEECALTLLCINRIDKIMKDQSNQNLRNNSVLINLNNSKVFPSINKMFMKNNTNDFKMKKLSLFI